MPVIGLKENREGIFPEVQIINRKRPAILITLLSDGVGVQGIGKIKAVIIRNPELVTQRIMRDNGISDGIIAQWNGDGTTSTIGKIG